MPAVPGAVGELGGHELLADPGVPAFPVVSTGQEHGLGGVVMPVEVVAARAERRVLRPVFQVGQPLTQGIVFIDPGIV